MENSKSTSISNVNGNNTNQNQSGFVSLPHESDLDPPQSDLNNEVDEELQNLDSKESEERDSGGEAEIQDDDQQMHRKSFLLDPSDSIHARKLEFAPGSYENMPYPPWFPKNPRSAEIISKLLEAVLLGDPTTLIADTVALLSDYDPDSNARDNSTYGDNDPGANARGGSTRKVTAERIFLVTNFVLEIPTLVFYQLSSRHKILYAVISLSFSIVVMLLCIAELVYKGRKARVSWRWRVKISWFYYPSPDHRRFGTVTDIIGLFSAIFQCVLTAVGFTFYLLHKDNPIKISILPLIFAFCLMCSKFPKISPERTPADQHRAGESNT